MDAVILAAGRGQRLDGIAAPFHKPLLVMNGKSLIVAAVDTAASLCGGVTVVVAPENASPISHVLGRRPVHMVVQRFPDGPGDALLEGLRGGDSKYVLVLMGDNLIPFDDAARIVSQQGAAIGVRELPLEMAKRFTYYHKKAKRWFEDGQPDESGLITTWCGPLKVDRQRARVILNAARNTTELKIGPHLDAILGSSYDFVDTETVDVGVPESLV